MLARAAIKTPNRLDADIDRLIEQSGQAMPTNREAKTVRLLTTDASGPGAREIASRLHELTRRGFEIRVLYSRVANKRAAKQAVAPFLEAHGPAGTRAAVRFATFRRAHELYPTLIIGGREVALDDLVTQNLDGPPDMADSGAVTMFDFLFDAAAIPSRALFQPERSILQSLFGQLRARYA